MLTSLGVTLNAADFALVAIILIGIVVGLSTGLIRQVLFLVSFYLSIVLSAQYYPVVGQLFSSWITDPSNRNLVALGLLLVVTTVILNVLSYSIYRQTSLPLLAWGDHLAGAALGLVAGWIIAGIIVSVLQFGTTISWQSWEANRFALQDLLGRSTLAPIVLDKLPWLLSLVSIWLPYGVPAPLVGLMR